jgi:hypothetical protein
VNGGDSPIYPGPWPLGCVDSLPWSHNRFFLPCLRKLRLGPRTQWKLRKATTKDAVTLSALNVDVQKIHADAFPHIFKYPTEDTFAVQFVLEQLADPSNYFFIANVNGEDIGYIYAKIVKRPENPFMYQYLRQITADSG